MNRVKSRNFLLRGDDVVDEYNYSDELFKFSMDLIKESKLSLTVLYIRYRQICKLPAVEKFDYDKEILKRINFMYFHDLDEVLKHLLNFHAWTVLPKLVVFDFNDFFEYNNTVSSLDDNTTSKICFLITTLFSYSSTTEKKLKSPCITITYIKENPISIKLLQRICALYFYNKNYTYLSQIKEQIEDCI